MRDGNEDRDDLSEEDINFFEELEALVDDVNFRSFSVTLMNGDRFRVDGPRQFVVMKLMYVYYPRSGGSVMFPFPNVCSVEVHDD